MKADTGNAFTQAYKNKFLLLLISLVITLSMPPLLARMGTLGSVLQFACLSAVFITGVLVNRHRKGMLYVAIAIASLAIPIMWSCLFVETYQLSLSRVLIAATFCSLTAVMILVSIFSQERLDSQAIYGATCSYLLIGLAWAMFYAGIEMFETESFRYADDAILKPDGTSPFPQLIYLSFVTMSTLGYGDITPVTPLAQIATWVQAVLGQFYLAVLIAYLVSALPERRPGDRPSKTANKEADKT